MSSYPWTDHLYYSLYTYIHIARKMLYNVTTWYTIIIYILYISKWFLITIVCPIDKNACVIITKLFYVAFKPAECLLWPIKPNALIYSLGNNNFQLHSINDYKYTKKYRYYSYLLYNVQVPIHKKIYKKKKCQVNSREVTGSLTIDK